MSKQAFPAAAEGMPIFNRRTFLQGAASTGVVVAPASTAAANFIPTGNEVSVADRIIALASEISHLLTQYDDAKWCIRIGPASEGQVSVRLKPLWPEPKAMAFDALCKLECAMDTMLPAGATGWVVFASKGGNKRRSMAIVDMPDASPGIIKITLGWGSHEARHERAS